MGWLAVLFLGESLNETAAICVLAGACLRLRLAVSFAFLSSVLVIAPVPAFGLFLLPTGRPLFFGKSCASPPGKSLSTRCPSLTTLLDKPVVGFLE